MKNYESLSHTRYDCKYHVVLIPKYRRKKSTGRFGGIWERFFTRWRSRRKVASWKGI